MKEGTEDNNSILPEDRSAPAKTKPDLFYIKRAVLKELDRHMDYALKNLQIIFDECVKFLGEAPTIEEIHSWFGESRRNFLVPNKEAIETYTRAKLFDKRQIKYPDLQFTPDIVRLPDLEPLIEACGQLIFINEVDFRERFFWQCFRINSGKIEIKQEELESVKNSWRIYAETAEEKAKLTKIRKLCDYMNTIKLFNPKQLVILGFVIYDDDTGTYLPDFYYVKGYIK
jgi:hypothetical protein